MTIIVIISDEKMVKITKTGEQYRINLPKEVVELTGWDEKTELAIFPYIKEPNSPITPDTLILIRKVMRR